MSRHAFTLIELLVVISIIAILAAMLLPAISMVRTQAKKADCASRMRQMGLAFGTYIQGNEGLYPIGSTAAQSWAAWYKAITEDSANPLTVAAGLSNYFSSGAAEWGKQFYCSEDKCTPTTDLTSLGPTRIAWDFYVVSHGYNAQGLGGMSNTVFNPTVGYTTPANSGSIRRSSETVLSIDTMDTSRAQPYRDAGYGHSLAGANASPGAFPRHGGRIANVLWVDGHVSGVSGIDQNALYSPTNLGKNNGSNYTPGSIAYIDTMWDRQ